MQATIGGGGERELAAGVPETPNGSAGSRIDAGWGRVWMWSLLVWGALTVVLEVPVFFTLYENGAIRRWEHFLAAPAMHIVSALLTPVMLMVVWRCPMDRAHRRQHIACVLAALLALAALDDALSYISLEGLRWFFPEVHRLHLWPLSKLTGIYARNLLTYSEIAAVAYAVLYYRQYQERSLRAAQLETHLVQARLEVLSRQLHPHFLFNTLNTVTALMHNDVEAAERMIARLSELLRAALNEQADQEVSLAHELELLDRYLEIEKVRFGARLTVERRIAPSAMEGRVPTFVLQVLVENALLHGVSRRSGPGHVEVAAEREDDVLILRVLDDGPGLDPEGGSHRGLGLSNTCKRLEQLYGDAATLELLSRERGGVEARVRLPFRSAGDARQGENMAAIGDAAPMQRTMHGTVPGPTS